MKLLLALVPGVLAQVSVNDLEIRDQLAKWATAYCGEASLDCKSFPEDSLAEFQNDPNHDCYGYHPEKAPNKKVVKWDIRLVDDGKSENLLDQPQYSDIIFTKEVKDYQAIAMKKDDNISNEDNTPGRSYSYLSSTPDDQKVPVNSVGGIRMRSDFLHNAVLASDLDLENDQCLNEVSPGLKLWGNEERDESLICLRQEPGDHGHLYKDFDEITGLTEGAYFRRSRSIDNNEPSEIRLNVALDLPTWSSANWDFRERWHLLDDYTIELESPHDMDLVQFKDDKKFDFFVPRFLTSVVDRSDPENAYTHLDPEDERFFKLAKDGDKEAGMRVLAGDESLTVRASKKKRFFKGTFEQYVGLEGWAHVVCHSKATANGEKNSFKAAFVPPVVFMNGECEVDDVTGRSDCVCKQNDEQFQATKRGVNTEYEVEGKTKISHHNKLFGACQVTNTADFFGMSADHDSLEVCEKTCALRDSGRESGCSDWNASFKPDSLTDKYQCLDKRDHKEDESELIGDDKVDDTVHDIEWNFVRFATAFCLENDQGELKYMDIGVGPRRHVERYEKWFVHRDQFTTQDEYDDAVKDQKAMYADFIKPGGEYERMLNAAKLNMKSVEANENDCGYHCIGSDSMFWRQRCTEGVGGKCEVDDSAPTTTGLKENDYRHWCHNPDMPCMSNSVKVLEDEFDYEGMTSDNKDDEGNSIPDIHVGAGCYSQTSTAKVCNINENQNVPSVSSWQFDHKVDWRVDYQLDLKLPKEIRACKEDEFNGKFMEGGRSVPGRNGPNKFCENYSGPGGESLKFGMISGNVVYENKSEPPYPKNLAFTETFDISWSKSGHEGPLAEVFKGVGTRSTHGFFGKQSTVYVDLNTDEGKEKFDRMVKNEGAKILIDYQLAGINGVLLETESNQAWQLVSEGWTEENTSQNGNVLLVDTIVKKQWWTGTYVQPIVLDGYANFVCNIPKITQYDNPKDFTSTIMGRGGFKQRFVPAKVFAPPSNICSKDADSITGKEGVAVRCDLGGVFKSEEAKPKVHQCVQVCEINRARQLDAKYGEEFGEYYKRLDFEELTLSDDVIQRDVSILRFADNCRHVAECEGFGNGDQKCYESSDKDKSKDCRYQRPNPPGLIDCHALDDLERDALQCNSQSVKDLGGKCVGGPQEEGEGNWFSLNALDVPNQKLIDPHGFCQEKGYKGVDWTNIGDNNQMHCLKPSTSYSASDFSDKHRFGATIKKKGDVFNNVELKEDTKVVGPVTTFKCTNQIFETFDEFNIYCGLAFADKKGLKNCKKACGAKAKKNACTAKKGIKCSQIKFMDVCYKVSGCTVRGGKKEKCIGKSKLA